MNSNGNLLGETLLDLQAAAKGLSDPGQLGQAEDELIRDVGNRNLTKSIWVRRNDRKGCKSKTKMHLSREGHEVMLTQAGDVNLTDEYHLIVVLCKYSVVDDVCALDD